MTPYGISVLLHYYTRPTPHPHELENPPIWKPTRDWLVVESLIEHNTPSAKSEWANAAWKLTERGEMYVRALMQVPLPVLTWAMPPPYDAVARGFTGQEGPTPREEKEPIDPPL